MSHPAPSPSPHHPVVGLRDSEMRRGNLYVETVVVDPSAIKVRTGNLRPEQITALQFSAGQRIEFIIYANEETIVLILSGKISKEGESKGGILFSRGRLPDQDQHFVTEVRDNKFGIAICGVVQEIRSDSEFLMQIHDTDNNPLNKLTVKFEKEKMR